MRARLLNWGPPVALLAILAAAVLTSGGGDDRYHVRAVFSDVSGLRKNSEVKVDGVTVGKVEKLSLGKGDAVVADLEIDATAGPIGRGARASLRAKNLLGAKLVDLDRGDLTRPERSGAEIPASHTDIPVDLDEVLAVLSPDVRTRLRVFIHETGVAMHGRGADFNRLLGELPSALDRTGALVAQLAADNRALGRLVEESDRVVASMSRERSSLSRLVVDAEGALTATADRHRELGATLREAPGSVAQLRSTFTELGETARPLGPAAERLRASAAPLTGVLRELPGMRPAAESALGVARRVSPDLVRLAEGSTPLVRRLVPTSQQLEETAVVLDPVSVTLDKAIGDGLVALEGWGRAIQGRDGLSHVFRGALTIGRDLSESLVQRFVRPPARDRKRTRRPAAERPAGTGPSAVRELPKRLEELPDRLKELPKTIDQLPKDLQKALGDALDNVLPGASRDRAPGSSGQDGLLDLLLGP